MSNFKMLKERLFSSALNPPLLDKKEAEKVFKKLGKQAKLKEIEKGKRRISHDSFHTTGFISAANSIGLVPQMRCA